MAELTLEQLKAGARKAAQAGDLATARKLLSRAMAMEPAKPATPRAENVVAETSGVPGGRVVRREDGSMAFVSPGASTSDPQIIERLLRGATYAEATKPDWQEAAIADSPVRSRAASAIQGVPFAGQYADEATGALFGEDAQNRQRFLADAVNERRPGQALGMKLATGIASAVPAAIAAAPAIATAAPASMAGRVGAGILGGILGGGTEGLISGYGAGADQTSRRRTAQDWGAEGAVAGGLLGGVLPLAASAIRRSADYLQDRFTGQRRTIPGLSREASEQVLLRAQADDIAGEGARNIQAAGPQGMIADAGPAMAGFTDQAVNMSPSGASIAGQNVRSRAAETADNLSQTFDNVFGDIQGQKAIATAIRDDARPGINAAYNEAYSQAVDYSAEAGRRIEGIVERMPSRIVKDAARRASERMTYDGAPAAQVLVQIAEDGKITKQNMPNVMQLDYIKRALDGIARDGTDAVTGKLSDDAAFASRMARDLRDALRDAVPAYGDALSQAADAFSLENARDLGQRLLARRTTRESVAEWLDGAGDLEKQTLRQALRSDIDERMANATRAAGSDEGLVEARKIFRDLSSRASREKMRAVLGDDADAVFQAITQTEKALELKKSVARGSDTAPRLVGDANLRSSQQYAPSEIAREAVSGGILSAPRRVLEVAAGNTPADVAMRNDALYGEIAQYLTGLRGNDALRQAGLMGQILKYAPGASVRSRAIGQVGSGLLGSLGYLSATQPQR